MATRKLTSSYLHSPGVSPYLGVTIGQLLYEAADRHPEKDMYVFYADKERITFKQMKEQSAQFAASLLSIGIEKGDRLALWGANHREWMTALYACTQLGIIAVQLRLEFPVVTIEAILKKTGCKVLLLTRSPSDLLSKACQIIPTLGSDSKSNLDCESLPNLKCVIVGDQNSHASGAYSMSEYLQLGSDKEKQQVNELCRTIDIDAPCIMYFTSGTTGIPKAVVHNHHALLNITKAGSSFRCDVQGFDPKWDSTRFAITMTFAGAASSIGEFLPLSRGCTTIILYPTYEREMMVKALQDERVTDGFFFIHQISDLLSLPNIDQYDLSHLRTVCLSGSVMPDVLRQRVKKFTKYITTCYGMTEMISSHFSHPFDPPHVIDHGAVRPVAGTEVKIVDNSGQIVPVDTMGEILYRGYSVFMYYWGDEKMTKETKDANGWLHTGDLGQMDEDGFIRILGRAKDIIIKESFNLSPGELETVLYQHPAIAGAMVAGVPDERAGEEVCACVIVKKGSHVTEEDIKAFCKDKVFSLLSPKYVLFVKTFPTTETGKFSRKRLAENAAKQLNLA